MIFCSAGIILASCAIMQVRRERIDIHKKVVRIEALVNKMIRDQNNVR